MKTKTEVDLTPFLGEEQIKEFYGNYQSFEEAWENCQNLSLMLEIAKNFEFDKKTIFLLKAQCAGTVKNVMGNKDSEKAVEVAEKYALGQVDHFELAKYRNPSYDAFDSIFFSIHSINNPCMVDSRDAAFECTTYSESSSILFESLINVVWHSIRASRFEKNKRRILEKCRESLKEELYDKINET